MELFRDYPKTREGIAGVKEVIDLTFFFAFGFFPCPFLSHIIP